ASLGGLGPDQVLVLVNGKRRHSSALVHVNGTFGRGTVGVDLNAIPAAAIERIEVLRDGAAAQYGSDAIAGVINVVLKEQAQRLDVTSTVGTAFFNSRVAISDDAEFYTFGGLSQRDGDAGAFYRLPNQVQQVVPEIFPNGFLPEIQTKLIDGAVTAGVRGTTRGWDVDFSLTRGQNDLQRYRNSIGVYAGLESQVSERFLVDVAGRYENYSDFGGTVNGKLATRLAVTRGVALRAAASTGFRAPSLHQAWYNSVTTQFVTVGGVLEPQNVLTTNNDSRITKAFGVPDLREETSVNLSGGLTLRPMDNLSITADAYRITID